MNTKKNILTVGLDEAGRGPLAGPVVAAAVILNPEKPITGLKDSKKLTLQQREKLYAIIMEQALYVGIGQSDVTEIDKINILQASLLAMERAYEALKIRADLALIDGKQCPKLNCPMQAIVRGDQSVPEISAASIIAKVTRDREMQRLDALYPDYGFAIHKGYPTAQHLQQLKRLGVLTIHRQSFVPVKVLLNYES